MLTMSKDLHILDMTIVDKLIVKPTVLFHENISVPYKAN